MTTLLVAEHDNKTLKDATAKALSAAKALGAEVHVLVAGKDCRAAADAAATLGGASKVLLADAAGSGGRRPEPPPVLSHWPRRGSAAGVGWRRTVQIGAARTDLCGDPDFRGARHARSGKLH